VPRGEVHVGRPRRSPRDILVRVSELVRNAFAPASAVRWPLRGELRMPLQPAIAGVTHAAIAACFYFHTALLAAVHIPGSSWPGIFVLVLLILVTGLYSLQLPLIILSVRACDIVLGPAGARVDGGSRHGLALAWAEIVPQRCRVEKMTGPNGFDDGSGRHRLIVGHVDGRDLVFAEAGDADDSHELRLICEEIQAVHAASAATPAAPDPSSRVLHCDRCGSAVPLADADVAACPMCRAAVAVPADLRVRFAEERAIVDARLDGQRHLRALLRQPTAAAVNRVFAAVYALYVLLPLLGAGALVVLRLRHFDPVYTVHLWLTCAGLCIAVGVLAGRFEGRRMVVRSRLREFAARHDGGPRCRSCNAALPVGDADLAIARCVYCRADNVLGIDLRPWARVEGGRRFSLSILRHVRGERVRDFWLKLGLSLGVALLAGARLLFAVR
jgi:hypothetical protein